MLFIKTEFSCILNAIIRGSLLNGILKFPTLLPVFFTCRLTGDIALFRPHPNYASKFLIVI